ncbi:DUF4059 family protein [Streptococcus constellatus subsp. pharyngis]|uniref:Amino acid transporter, AAT family n=3 Tax=Streptococcus TaxID=1301 RepID=F9P4E0_STRCV|nr:MULTISPECIES: DUF4059 family protein [Streptococcus]EHG13232.1 hypothetical protein HMPREF9682_01118 [Streptococcus intermedius F0395]AGU72255.1 hypothetical protein SCRE_0393 [Streptococcus constellatus subsp. pharyngis C232]AGU74011.1 hypothetical protein SCR2_0393 [Streptococcus constellatus subsp. pharyngis C818]AGU79379.1 hypothetical protein SCI_0413 [Streptococcus constellatus subsp. pharyngis C1050]EGV10749.1 hypothetical protein HMPREF1042_0336 [Streptococcus constellatus subsp. ph
MLFRVFILYLESLLITALLVGSFLGLWIGLRAVRRVDKTVRDRQAHLYDMLLIAVMTIPILSFAMMGILLVLKA